MGSLITCRNQYPVLKRIRQAIYAFGYRGILSYPKITVCFLKIVLKHRVRGQNSKIPNQPVLTFFLTANIVVDNEQLLLFQNAILSTYVWHRQQSLIGLVRVHISGSTQNTYSVDPQCW